MNTPTRHGIRILAATGLILMSACGSPKRATTDVDVNSTSNVPLFDTSNQSPTGTSTVNLFDTQGSAQLTEPTQGSGQLQEVTQAETYCLSNDSGFGLQNFGGSQAGTSTNANIACVNQGSYGVDPSALYQGAITSYQAMDYCLQQAAQYAPRAGQTQLQVEMQMQFAELSLVICMRDVVEYQYNILPWGNMQTAAFQHADHNLWYIGQGIRR